MKKLFSSIILLGIVLFLWGCGDPADRLVNAPEESYVIECLQKVPGILEIKAVTEDNDPNGQLNKAGGYTSQVFFSYFVLDQDEIYGTTLIDKGTNAGGCVEVYGTKEAAEKRNNYLATFDGGNFSSGSHTVIGTCVVRTSNELTASQQKTLTDNIIAALTGDDASIKPVTTVAQTSKPLVTTTAPLPSDPWELAMYTLNIQIPEPLFACDVENSESWFYASSRNLVYNEDFLEYIELLEKEGFLGNIGEAGFPEKYYKAYNADKTCYIVVSCDDFYEGTASLSIYAWSLNSKEEIRSIQNAVDNAEQYEREMDSEGCFITPQSLREYLEGVEGYPVSFSKAALELASIDWNKHAISAVEWYADQAIGAYDPFFDKNVYISQLLYDEFDLKTAEYALINADVNWEYVAEEYLDILGWYLYCDVGFCEEDGAFVTKDSFVCPKCNSSVNSLETVFAFSEIELKNTLKEMGYSDEEAECAISLYCDEEKSLFDYGNNRESWLAQYSLEMYIDCQGYTPERETAQRILEEWGYDTQAIEFAISAFY